MPSPIFLSQPPPGFSLLSILRGFELAFLGGYKALQDKNLFKQKYYRKAIKAFVVSIIIEFILKIPLLVLRIFVKFLEFFFTGKKSINLLYEILNTLSFLQNTVFSLPQLLIGLVLFLNSDIDHLFMSSLRFIDSLYIEKHPERQTHVYFKNLALYNRGGFEKNNIVNATNNATKNATENSEKNAIENAKNSTSINTRSINKTNNTAKTIARYTYIHLKKASISLLLYIFSFTPIIGPFILPVATFYNFNSKVGTWPSVCLFISGFFVPKQYIMIFLSAYWGSESIMRRLLDPYFSRLPFSAREKQAWFNARQGVLFGFGVTFYFLLKLPFVSLLVYGFAQASTAYLITKISDPPPVPEKVFTWTPTQVVWTGRKALERNIDFEKGSTNVNKRRSETVGGSMLRSRSFDSSLNGGFPGSWSD